MSYSLKCVKSFKFGGVFWRFAYSKVQGQLFCSNKTITLVFCEGQRMSLDEVTVIHQAISVVEQTLPLGPTGPYISILSVTTKGFHSAHLQMCHLTTYLEHRIISSRKCFRLTFKTPHFNSINASIYIPEFISWYAHNNLQ